MFNNSFRFSIGQLDCLVVNDGSLIVPPPPSEKPSDQPGSLQGESMNVLSLYIDSGDHKILVDTGCGDKFQGTDTGKLANNLKAAGVRCDDIDIIIFTHGHLDHAAGTLDKSGKAVFPKARYIVAKKEWQCWEDKKERPELQMLFTAARQDLLSIPEKFHLANEGEEILPGIVLTTAPGHTPGSSILHICSNGEKLTCIGDLIHSAKEFSCPDYYDFLDIDPEKAIQSRTEVLSKLAKSGEMAFICHFPFPGLGYLVKKSDVLDWQPLKNNQSH
jgi:glyoxylase-like metal-dependent hydrolase (beta-lactamase superfamily II)